MHLGTLGRVMVIGANVFRAVMRDRVLYLLGVYGLTLALAQRLLPEIAATTEKKMLLDLGLALMQVLGAVLAIFVSTSIINQEVEKKTVYILVAKPVSRPELIMGKFLGLAAVLGLLVFLMTLIHGGILLYGGSDIAWRNFGLNAGFVWLQLSLIAAIGLGFGSFTSSLLALVLTVAVYVAGLLSQDMVKLGRLSKNASIEQVTQTLYTLLPDLSRLDLKNQLVYHQIPNDGILGANLLYGMLYITLVLTITSLIFSRREF